MRIGITGASGLIGTALVAHLRPDHEVIRFVRRPASTPDERRWDGTSLEPQAVEDLDAMVHLAGAGVGNKRWTKAYKKELVDSRLQGTRAVATAVAKAGTPVLLSASAVGWYGDTGPVLTDETGTPGRGFLAELCMAWERATEGTQARVVHLRSGIVQSTKGGALRKQLPIFKARLGAPLGSGQQWVSWISLADEVGAITHLLTADVEGPVNLVAPHPVTNREYTKALGNALHRATLPIGVPRIALKAALGQVADDLLIGQRVRPAVLESSGYGFVHPDLSSALEHALSGR